MIEKVENSEREICLTSLWIRLPVCAHFLDLVSCFFALPTYLQYLFPRANNLMKMEILQVQHASTAGPGGLTTFQQEKVLGSKSKDDTCFGFGPPGLSPISPKSVMMLRESTFDLNSTLPPSLPTPQKQKTDQGIHDPFHGKYLLTPSNHVLEPIVRTVLEAGRGGIDIATMIIDDVLVHQLFMNKSGDHVFSCTLGSAGTRIVMARRRKMFPSSSRDSAGAGGLLEFEQEFDIYCSEKTPVDSLLRHLQTHDVEVEVVDPTM